MDGVLANFNLSFGKLFIQQTGHNLFGDNWESELSRNEFPPVWNWESHAGYTPEQVGAVWAHIKQDIRFWRNLGYLPDAFKAVKKLNNLVNAGHDVYFLTNRMGQQAKLQSEKWLYDLGMNYPTVVMAADKLPLIKAIGLNLFIDDNYETVLEVAAANLDGLKLYLRRAPYNQFQAYPDNVKHVDGVLDALFDAYGV